VGRNAVSINTAVEELLMKAEMTVVNSIIGMACRGGSSVCEYFIDLTQICTMSDIPLDWRTARWSETSTQKGHFRI